MEYDELFVALLAFMAFVALVPAWTHYIGGFAAARPADAFLAALVLPAAATLFLASWIKPEMSGVLLGGFLLVGVVLMYPWLWEMTDMVSGELVENPLAQFILRLSVSALVITFLVSLGRRRLARQ